MTKTEAAVKAAIELLLSMGWQMDGQTRTETVRIPTSRSPLFGGIGGEIRTFGGRTRLSRGDRRRVTVGKRTTCFYVLVEKEARDFVSVDTKDIERIRTLAADLKEAKSAP